MIQFSFEPKYSDPACKPFHFRVPIPIQVARQQGAVVVSTGHAVNVRAYRTEACEGDPRRVPSHTHSSSIVSANFSFSLTLCRKFRTLLSAVVKYLISQMSNSSSLSVAVDGSSRWGKPASGIRATGGTLAPSRHRPVLPRRLLPWPTAARAGCEPLLRSREGGGGGPLRSTVASLSPPPSTLASPTSSDPGPSYSDPSGPRPDLRAPRRRGRLVATPVCARGGGVLWLLAAPELHASNGDAPWLVAAPTPRAVRHGWWLGPSPV